MEKEEDKCISMRRGLDIIGSKWKLLIIESLKGDKKRYGELKRLIPLVSEKMLIQELKSLVEFGLVERKAYPEVPPKVEYWLTDKGKEVLPIISNIIDWSDRNF